MITILYAHPYPRHSRAGQALLGAVQDLPGVQVRSLYTLYPDFHIDVRAEQSVLQETRTLVLQHPMHWYHVPALLSLWMEKVLAHGWAYGHDTQGQSTQAMAGKRMLWVSTTGGDEAAYQTDGSNHYTIAQLAAPLRQTALFCGMQWVEPYTVHHARKLDEAELLRAAEGYRLRLIDELTPSTATGGDHAR